MLEHDIAPQAWALWAVQRARDAQLKAGKTPAAPYVLAVLSATYIARCRGFFRRSTTASYGRQVTHERVHEEQLFRKREAHRRARGMVDPLLGLPAWYVTQRQQEIAAMPVAADPRHLFPRAAKARR